jgi:hypothetical protein
VIQSSWNRFTTRIKRPFRLDQSLSNNDPDYYTAIYSSSIPKFEALFDTLRGPNSRPSYFTPAERSLLTYELLSRAHCQFIDDDDDEDENQTEPAARAPGRLT